MNWLTGFATRGLGSVNGSWRKRQPISTEDKYKPTDKVYVYVDLAQVQALRDQGMKLRDIADHLGMPYNQLIGKVRALSRCKS